MKLSRDQLADYLEVMNEKAAKAMEGDFRIHGFMIYQCEDCNSVYVMWLAEGLEDPTDDAKTGKHKPVPFGIVCPACGGTAFHKFWGVGKLTLGQNHRSYKDYISQQNKLLYENFFWNDPDSDCGVPIILSPDYQMVVPGLTNRFLERILVTTAMEFMDKKDVKEHYIFDEDLPEETSVDVALDGLRNRHERRHPNQHDGYKRPRSNKKLYEY